MRVIFLIAVIFLFQAKSSGQKGNRLITYHAVIHLNYAAGNIPDFTFPFGIGAGVTATLNKYSKFRPTVDLNANAFPEFVLHLFGDNGANDAKYSYGVYNVLIGAKYRLTEFVKISLVTGSSINSVERFFDLAIKPTVEFNIRGEKLMIAAYYLGIIGSKELNGYTGLSAFLKVR